MLNDLHFTSEYRQFCPHVSLRRLNQKWVFSLNVFLSLYMSSCVLQCAVPEAVGKDATGWFLRGFPLSFSWTHVHGRSSFTLTFILQGYTACQSSCCTLHTGTISKEAYSKKKKLINNVISLDGVMEEAAVETGYFSTDATNC